MRRCRLLIDITLRLLIVATIGLAVALLIVMAHRSTRTRPAGSIDVDGFDLEPGLVLFTSATCPTCVDARAVADRVLGRGSYREWPWEDNPDALATAGIDEVPLIAVIGRGGRVRSILRGVPHPFRLRVERIRSRL